MTTLDPRDAPAILEIDTGDLLETVTRYREGRMSRRRFLTRTAAMGLSVLSVGALLRALGESAVLAGEAENPGDGGLIGLNHPYNAAQVVAVVYDGAEAAAAARGYQLLRSGVQNGQLDQQLAEINQWIALGVLGMTILPVDPNAFGPTVEKAHEAGVLSVGGFDGHIPGEDTWMGFNQSQGVGQVAGMADLHIQGTLGGNCKIAGLVISTLPQSKLRVDDCIQLILDHNPGAELVGLEEAGTSAEALDATQALLQAQPEIQMIICMNDDDVIGAVQAMKLAGKQPQDIWLAGYDGAKQALTMLKNDEFVGVDAALPLLTVGEVSVNLPANVIEGKEPHVQLVDYAVVTNGDDVKIDELIASYG